MLLAFVTLVVCAHAAAAQTPTLSLDEALAIAIAHNRSLENATLAAENADRDVTIARTRRFVSFAVEAQASQLLKPIDINFAQGTFGTFPGIGPVPATDTQITTPTRPAFILSASASQPLTQLPRINLGIKANEAARDGARAQVRSTRVQLVADVKRLYFAMLQTSSALTATGYQAALLEELGRVVGNRVVQQVALKAESLDVDRRLAQIELRRVTLQNTLASQKEQFNQLLGRNVSTSFDIAGVPSPARADLNLEAAQARAISARPDVALARVKVRQAEISEQLARKDSTPDLSVGLSYLSPMNVEGAPRTIATVGVQLQWEPFDWGRKATTVATRGAELRQARNAAADAEARAVLEVNARFRKLEEARGRLKVAGLAQETARENARVRLAQYSVQAALLTDTLQTQAALADSTDEYQQALMSLYAASADYDQALGEDGTR
jgi:outer membrane protein TolC